MNAKCEHCDGNIGIVVYWDAKRKEEVIDHGRCINCLRNIVLPCEPFRDFKKYCVNIESIN